MLKLNDVTLLSLFWGDNEHSSNSVNSMQNCIDRVEFGGKIIITDTESANRYDKFIQENDITVVSIGESISSDLKDDVEREKFSNIFLKKLQESVKTEFCLNIQSDSTIIDQSKWTDHFLDYDYIGAPWPEHILRTSDMCQDKIKWFPNVVGNGGFSIRSKRFIDSCFNLEIFHKNEDLNICVFNYYNMVNRGIKFAPSELAYKFSVEHPIKELGNYDRRVLSTYGSFGFHGDFNPAGMGKITQGRALV